MTSTIILSQYPLTDDTRSKLEQELLEKPSYLVVSNFAHSGHLSLIRQLRSISCDRLIVYAGESQNSTMLPVFRFMGAIITARDRYILSLEGDMAHWTRFALLRDALLIAASLFLAIFVALIAASYFFVINRKGRVPVSHLPADFNKKVIYLRATLWHGMNTGGAVSHARGVISGFLATGYNVECLADSVLLDIPEGRGVNHIVSAKTAYVLPRELNNLNYQLSFISSLWRRYRSGFSGLIYQRLSIAGFSGLVLSRIWRVPIIIEYNGSEIWLSKNWGSRLLLERLVDFFEKSILQNAHLVVAVSEALKKDLIKRGVEETRIVVCANGVDTDFFKPSVMLPDQRQNERVRLGFQEDDIVFTFVSSFGAWHGAGVLADAINLFSDGADEGIENKCKFLLIGDGVEFSEIERRLRTKIESGKVVMTGLIEQDKIPSLLEISDVCLTPTLQNSDGSEFFGSPTKLFEYLSSGKAVIASQLGQVASILKDSPHVNDLIRNEAKNGLNRKQFHNSIGVLFDAGNSAQLKAAITLIAVHSELRIEMGALGRLRAIEDHTWDKHVSKFVDAATKLLFSERSKPVRVLLNALHSKSGGGVTYLRNILPILCADQRLEIHVCLNEKQMSLFEPWLGQATVHKVALDDSLWRTILYEQISLPGLARKIEADVTFSPANYGPVFAPNTVVLLRNALSVAFVERRLPKMLYWAMLYLGTLSSVFMASKVISVSEYARKSTVGGMFDWASDKFRTTPHGISANFEPDPSSKREKKSLLFVSDIYVQKNLHGFFKSLAILKKQFPDIKMRVAGAPVDLDYNDRIKTLMNDLQLGDVVEFLGNLGPAELTQEYRRTTLFVFPSTVETFGNPLVEAMACGAPIACSRTAAMPEVAGEAAEYFDPYDAEDMARVVDKLLEDEERREELSRLGIERSKRYSWEETARKTADVLIDAARN